MPAQPLTQVLILLFASVVVVAIARRQGLPPILGYLVVGMLLGPLAFGLLPNGTATQTLANIGVVFLLFTLGLDFLWARMVAMRREVFGLGAAQLLAVGVAVALLLRTRSVDWVSGRGAGRRCRHELHGDRAAAAHRSGRTQPHPRAVGVRGAAVPGSGVRAAAGAGDRPGARWRVIQRHQHSAPGGGGPAGADRGAGHRPLGAATAVLRDRPQPAARAVHLDGAAGGAELRLDHARGSGCRWRWARFWPA